MTIYKCKLHKIRNCSTCRAQQSGSSGYSDSTVWVPDTSGHSSGGYDSSSSSSGSDSSGGGGGCGSGGGGD